MSTMLMIWVVVTRSEATGTGGIIIGEILMCMHATTVQSERLYNTREAPWMA